MLGSDGKVVGGYKKVVNKVCQALGIVRGKKADRYSNLLSSFARSRPPGG